MHVLSSFGVCYCGLYQFLLNLLLLIVREYIVLASSKTASRSWMMIEILRIILLCCITLGCTRGRTNTVPCCEKITPLRGGGSIGSGLDLLQKSTDFIVGKDRELLHASIDLKWLFETLFSKQLWHGLYEDCIHRLLQMHPGYNAECEYRNQASKILREIHELNSAFSLRILQKSIHLAEDLSYATQRPILLYCEEESDDVIPSLETFLFRRALASEVVGNEINRNFLLMACFKHHPYAKSLLDVINSDPTRRPLNAPFLLVLYPGEITKRTLNYDDEHERGDSMIHQPKRPFNIHEIVERGIPSFKCSSNFDIGPIFSMPQNSRDESELARFLHNISDRGKIAVTDLTQADQKGVEHEDYNMWR